MWRLCVQSQHCQKTPESMKHCFLRQFTENRSSVTVLLWYCYIIGDFYKLLINNLAIQTAHQYTCVVSLLKCVYLCMCACYVCSCDNLGLIKYSKDDPRILCPPQITERVLEPQKQEVTFGYKDRGYSAGSVCGTVESTFWRFSHLFSKCLLRILFVLDRTKPWEFGREQSCDFKASGNFCGPVSLRSRLWAVDLLGGIFGSTSEGQEGQKGLCRGKWATL